MTQKMHKLFQTVCDVGEAKMVSALECNRCPYGSVVDNRSRVLCGGITKFFVVPCYYEMKAAATLKECELCFYGKVSDDRLRVFCDRM